jgi:hypothetical protein
MLSLAISCNTCPAGFLTGAFFCFFASGGVFDSIDISPAESTSDGGSSSSLSGLGRFLVAGLVAFIVVCTSFLVVPFAALGAFAAFGTFLAVVFFAVILDLIVFYYMHLLVLEGLGFPCGSTKQWGKARFNKNALAAKNIQQQQERIRQSRYHLHQNHQS